MYAMCICIVLSTLSYRDIEGLATSCDDDPCPSDPRFWLGWDKKLTWYPLHSHGKITCYRRNDCSCKCCECQATSLHMYQIGWAKTQQFDSVLRTQIQCFWIRSIDGFAVVWLSLACSADLPWVPSAKSYRLLCQFAESDLILSQGGEVAVDAISFHTYQADTG